MEKEKRNLFKKAKEAAIYGATGAAGIAIGVYEAKHGIPPANAGIDGLAASAGIASLIYAYKKSRETLRASREPSQALSDLEQAIGEMDASRQANEARMQELEENFNRVYRSKRPQT